MWRAVFLALGIYCLILGAEALILDKVILSGRSSLAGAAASSLTPGGMRDVIPAEWAPWSLLSAGTVVMLYTITIPKRSSA